MKRYALGIVMAPLLAAGQVNAAPIYNAIMGTGGAVLLLEDNSRELLVDVDGSGSLSPGDVLVGYIRVDNTSPPSVARDNDIYAVFSQTFDPQTFQSSNVAGGTRYSGTFIPTPDASPYSLESLLSTNAVNLGGFDDSAMIAFIDETGGFSQDLTTADLPPLGNVDGAISSILDAEGTVRFTVGFSDAADFFAFETVPVGGAGQPADFVANPAATQTIPTSQILGNFGAGMSVLDNYMPVNFLRDQATTFFQNNTNINYGQGSVYDVAVLNGNFGGIFDGSGVVQGGGLSFINNADATIHAVPEPSSLALLGAGLALFGFGKRRKSRA